MRVRGLLFGLLVLTMVSAPPVTIAQMVADDEVAKGIRQVNDGDYDGAIVTLDAAVRRLDNDPAKINELAQGYLYLGIAYVGKGHEAAAKAKFREAVRQMHELSLSPEQFPPKVINLFEAAREELRKASPTESSQAAAGTAQRPTQKSGNTKYIFIGGGIAAAGVSAALILGGGGDGQSVVETPPPEDPIITESRTGFFRIEDTYHRHEFGPGGAGHWVAEVTWTGGDRFIVIEVFQGSVMIAEGRQAAPTLCLAEWEGVAGAVYEIHLWVDEEFVRDGFEYQLVVSFPRP